MINSLTLQMKKVEHGQVEEHKDFGNLEDVQWHQVRETTTLKAHDVLGA